MPQNRGFDRVVSHFTRRTLAIVMAGGRGKRLMHLTDDRAKPATPFGGKFRIIDFALSNCVNSGIRQIYVLTQYKAQSLIRHLQRGWGYLHGELGEFIDIAPAQQLHGEWWYKGTADAVYQNLDAIDDHSPNTLLILAGDHVYKMDYGPLVLFHKERGADVTIGGVQVPLEQASEFGVMSVDTDGRITAFDEKPERATPMPGREGVALASMGIYVFEPEFLREALIKDAADPSSAHDFGRDIVPKAIRTRNVFAYAFQDIETKAQSYWRDVGTVDAYYAANMELVHVSPELNLYDRRWPIWTYQAQVPAAKFVLDDAGRRGMAVNSMVAGGCIISGATVRESLLSTDVLVDEYSTVIRSVILPDVEIGRNCYVANAIVDEGSVIPDGMIIGMNADHDRSRFYISPNGVVLVTRRMLAELGPVEAPSRIDTDD
ncbi:MAG: glucose-1-phosphate adenylyltransferase [Gammaproteobacteria bacterium]|jgi:glucose-1-phosphate adenylyltransferase